MKNLQRLQLGEVGNVKAIKLIENKKDATAL